MKTWLSLLILASAAWGQDWHSGFRLQGLRYEGPGEWRLPADPIWVYEYHTLRLRYRAWNLPPTDAPVLTLRPGAVGPVTPGATNRENPFAAGRPVVAAAARDLASGGRDHTLEIELRGRMLTAQVDELRFSLPAGARLEVEDLEFRAGPEAVPCAPGTLALPQGARKLNVSGPAECGGFPATSLRGRESLRIETGGACGATLYLALLAHVAGLSDFVSGRPVDRWRIREHSETSDVLVRIRYAGGSEEEQFPLLVRERRHALLNRTPELYSLALEPRPLASVEVLDRSPHVQLAVFAAGLAETPPPLPADEMPPAAARGKAPGEMNLKSSKWFQIEPGTANLRPELKTRQEGRTRVLSLSVTNTGAAAADFTLVFPSIEARDESAWYLYPRQGAVISRANRILEDVYGTRFALQFMDLFSPSANRGACVIVRDTEGRYKSFRLARQQASIRLEARYPVRLAPGETYRAPDVAVVSHGGDWREGFQAYREWVAQWYRPAGPRPEWLRSAFWCRRDYPIGGSGRLFDVSRNRYTFDDLIRDGQAFGGIDFIDISGWALSDSVGRVGDYPIELGGPADLRRNIALAAERGIPTGLYFEGYLIDKNSGIGRRSGEAWQLIDAAGRRMWWPGGSPELFVCPLIPEWQQYLAGRMAAVAREVGAQAVYLDEHGLGNRRCFSNTHGHAPGAGAIPGEIRMAGEVRRALDRAGLRQTAVYTEFNPVDAAAPCYDAAFCYALQHADPRLSTAKLNLWRFAFPDVRLWDMVSVGVHPRSLPAEDFRLSLWHGNGAWLKGHSETWYAEETLAFLRRARALLKQHAAAFGGAADPLVESPHRAVFVNRFRGGGRTVYTLFNSAYRTVRFSFLGRAHTLGPREVEVAEAVN